MSGWATDSPLLSYPVTCFAVSCAYWPQSSAVRSIPISTQRPLLLRGQYRDDVEVHLHLAERQLRHRVRGQAETVLRPIYNHGASAAADTRDWRLEKHKSTSCLP